MHIESVFKTFKTSPSLEKALCLINSNECILPVVLTVLARLQTQSILHTRVHVFRPLYFPRPVFSFTSCSPLQFLSLILHPFLLPLSQIPLPPPLPYALAPHPPTPYTINQIRPSHSQTSRNPLKEPPLAQKSLSSSLSSELSGAIFVSDIILRGVSTLSGWGPVVGEKGREEGGGAVYSFLGV